MPCTMTKFLFAKRVLKVLHNKLPQIPIKDDYFFLGAQGAGVFGDESEQANEASAMLKFALEHHHICDIFAKFNSFSQQYATYQNAAKSYALGYMCYYGLSRRVNPFVLSAAMNYAKEIQLEFEPNQAALITHVERQLDSFVISLEADGKPDKINADIAFPSILSIEKFLCKLYTELSHDLFDMAIDSQQLAEAIDRTVEQEISNSNSDAIDKISIKLRGFISGIFNKNHHSLASITPTHMDSDYDYANSSNDIWIDPFDPTQEQKTDSFQSIFNNAVAEAVHLCAGYMLYERGSLELCEATECLSVITGQPMQRVFDKSDYDYALDED